MGGRIRRPDEPRNPVPPPVPVDPAPVPADRVPPAGEAPPYAVGSYGNRSIDRHDAAFVAASRAVEAARGVRVDPRFLKAMMEVESGGDGDYPPDRCRPADAYDRVPACGPMQIKFAYHRDKCPACDLATVAGQVELAAHVLGEDMARHGHGLEQAFLSVYFPGDDNNGTTQAAYLDKVRGLVRTMAADAAGATPVPTTPVPVPEPTPRPDPWRPYPWPAMVDLVVAKPGERAGFDRCAPRGGRIEGFCTHITDGPPSQQIEFFRDFFGTGGARAWDALTDLVIGWDGRIGLLNDWRDPARGGTRAGWANGGVDGLEGEGVAFYRRFPAINEVLVSCEHAQKAGGPWSDAMIASSIEVRVAQAQALRVPAASYPVNPRTGLTVELQHRHFAAKSCPANPYVSTIDAAIKREVRAKLAAWQGGDAEPPAPEPPATFTDFGMTLAQVANEFGTLTRHNADGTTDALPFDPAGPVSLSWLRRCEREGVFPEAEEMRLWDSAVRPGAEWWVSFGNGWRLVKPAGDTRADWFWLDEEVAG